MHANLDMGVSRPGDPDHHKVRPAPGVNASSLVAFHCPAAPAALASSASQAANPSVPANIWSASSSSSGSVS